MSTERNRKLADDDTEEYIAELETALIEVLALKSFSKVGALLPKLGKQFPWLKPEGP